MKTAIAVPSLPCAALAALLLTTGVVRSQPAAAPTPAETPATNALPAWLTRPLSLADAVDIAMQQNAAVLRARKDLEANAGIVMQTRAIALPKVGFTGEYAHTDQQDNLTGQNFTVDFSTENRWNTSIRLVQSIYEGGRIRASLRTANLSKEQAILAYQTVVADTVTEVRVTYYNTLLAAELIGVREASVKLLTKELEDTTRRFEAGTVPRFNVLRAEVELANARPPLIRARNAYRIAKNNLGDLLGYNVPRHVWEDIPLQLTDKLTAEPYDISLPVAIGKALELRPELGVLQKAERIRQENIIQVRAGYLPSFQAYGGYGVRKSQFSKDMDAEIHGYEVGVQLNWNIWDGNLTRGKVIEAKALHEKAQVELDDTGRRIELEVRTSYSSFVEAREVLESQKKVVEQAEEALRLANSRYDAGTGTQLDVLSAQTALTEARSTTVEALRGYEVARARLERAIGVMMPQPVTTTNAARKEAVTPVSTNVFEKEGVQPAR